MGSGTRKAIETDRQGSLFEWAESDRVNRFLRFADEYLTVPHGYGGGERFKFAPTQMEWIRSFVDNSITVVSVGRGGGKSTLAAAIALWWAVDPPEGERRPEIVIVSNSIDQSRGGVFNTATAMLEDSPRLSEIGYYYHDTNNPRIKFLNGGEIKIRTAHPTRLQGMIPSLTICDEIGGIPRKVWNTLVQGLGKRHGSTLIGIGTPLYEREVLFEIHEQHQAGKLARGVNYIRHAADEGADLDDVTQWRKANPVRAELNPDGWIDDLAVIRSMVPDAEWQLMHLALWADIRGAPLLTPERFDELAGHKVPVSDWEDLGIYVAVVSDWERKSVAVVACACLEQRISAQPLLVTAHQPEPVDNDTIAEAVMALGEPAHVSVSTSSTAGELVQYLEDQGLNVTGVNVTSPSKMSQPSDTLIRLVADRHLSHDGQTGPFRDQLLAARQEVGKDGPRFMRDDRTGERTDSVVALAVAAHAAYTSPRVAFY